MFLPIFIGLFIPIVLLFVAAVFGSGQGDS